MAEAVRWLLIDAVRARIAALSQFRLVEVGRDSPVSIDQHPAVLIDDAGQSTLTETSSFQRFELRLALTVLARGGQGRDVIRELTAHHAAVIAALYSDQSLGGLADEIGQGDVAAPVLAERADARTAEMTFDLAVQYSTLPGDPYTRAG